MTRQRAYRIRKLLIGGATFALCGFMASGAMATNGYFSHGYGIKSKALAGAGVAVPLDSLTAASNPAAMVFLGQRADLAVSIFNPNRNYNVTGAPSGFPGTFPLAPGEVESDSKYFVIPSLGANWMLESGNGSLGASIYGNGGMNTDYETHTFGGAGASTGVDLAQLFLVPTYARKINKSHSFGISPILAYQRFEAQGLQQFSFFSSSPTNLTNNGYENSWGYGVRIGYYGEISPILSIGASYQSTILMSELDKYQGLFAEQGGFDIPSNWTIGVAIRPNEAITIAFDVQTIYYSEIDSINNPLLPNLMTSPLGSDNGAGFGWDDMTIFKLGLQWQSSPEWTWRAGFSYGEQPIPESEVLFNILAPGVIETHATVGFTRKIGTNQELDFALMRAFENSVSGPNPLDPGENIELSMDQWEASFGYSWKF
jgi:long-chain fatty acid transport protein